MLTNKQEGVRQLRTELWATRDNVQRHALSMSMPWLAFVNIAFALMVFFRNFIFTHFDKKLLTHQVVDHLRCDLLVLKPGGYSLCRSRADRGYYYFGNFSHYCRHAAPGAGALYVEHYHRPAAGTQPVLVPE